LQFFARSRLKGTVLDGECSIMVSNRGNRCPFNKAQLIADFWVNWRGGKSGSVRFPFLNKGGRWKGDRGGEGDGDGDGDGDCG
jgi:hypothetical protein